MSRLIGSKIVKKEHFDDKSVKAITTTLTNLNNMFLNFD
jgi:hypothetical protein